MIVDDRLDTVLRTQAAGRAGLNTQLRQLLDILGRIPDSQWGARETLALQRFDDLHATLGDAAAAVLTRLCTPQSPRLVAHLATRGPRTAQAAIAQARLTDAQWLRLVPGLPIHARGLLRHRRDLGPPVVALLNRLGIDDFVLSAPHTDAAAQPDPGAAQPEPAVPDATAIPTPAATAAGGVLLSLPIDPARRPDPAAREGIGAIVRRIEAFRRDRATNPLPTDQPAVAGQTRLPFADEPGADPIATMVDVVIDGAGTIIASDGVDPALLVGHTPFVPASPASAASVDDRSLAAFRARQPIVAGMLLVDGAARIAGSWRIDAVPQFGADAGQFTGYRARLRRPAPQADAPTVGASTRPAHDPGTDTLHQMLHELRTPINAIQGFAELIQQQVLGPTPHQYRSLAASIAADAARMLAGFEDVERLVRLETGRIDAPATPATAAGADLTTILTRLITQLEPMTAPREIRLRWAVPDQPTPVAMPVAEAERTLWRLVSTLIAAAAPGERMTLMLTASAGAVHLALSLPAALAQRDDDALFAPDVARAGSAHASGMLGAGFALRLCAAEIVAAGGRVDRPGPANSAILEVTLPLARGVALDRAAVAS